MKWSPHMPWKCRARLARHREFHGLLNPELEQRFARDLQLLTLLGRSNCSSTNGPDERANSRTFSSPCNTPDERAQPCTAYHFPRCLLALALALDLVRAGEQRISRAINNDVCQFKRELGTPRHLARRRCLCKTAVDHTPPSPSFRVIGSMVHGRLAQASSADHTPPSPSFRVIGNLG